MIGFKKVFALILTGAIVLSGLCTVVAKTYPDVSPDALYADAVSALSELKIIEGDENGNFNPEATITRAEFAKVLSAALGATAFDQTDTVFKDVPKAHWASGYIAYAAQKGIISGYGDGLFGPEDPVTYEQAVKMIVAALGFGSDAEGKGGYPNGYIIVAAEKGITYHTMGKVNDPALRGTVAILIANALPIIKGTDNEGGAPVMEGLLAGKQLDLIYEDAFETNKNNFKLEGMGRYDIKDGVLYLSDPIDPKSGTTLWVNRDFSGDLYVSYNCKAVNLDGAKNLNLFFLATTLDGKDVLSEVHSGIYGDYHKTVNSYILTFTGDYSAANDGWSRFRKDPGFIILSEDPTAKTLLNTNYFIELIKAGNRIQVKINGRLIHDITDPQAYTGGKIGFRTWQSETVFDNFKVYQVK